MIDPDMASRAASADPATPDTLTAAQRAEAARLAEERALAKLGHAVTFLNNHLPMLGGRAHAVGEGYGECQMISSPLFIDDVREDVAKALEDALRDAAIYAGGCFRAGE